MEGSYKVAELKKLLADPFKRGGLLEELHVDVFLLKRVADHLGGEDSDYVAYYLQWISVGFSHNRALSMVDHAKAQADAFFALTEPERVQRAAEATELFASAICPDWDQKTPDERSAFIEDLKSKFDQLA